MKIVYIIWHLCLLPIGILCAVNDLYGASVFVGFLIVSLLTQVITKNKYELLLSEGHIFLVMIAVSIISKITSFFL